MTDHLASDPKLAFFDGLASRWDAMEKPHILGQIRQGLLQFALAPQETVLDVGCGTGNSVISLLSLLGDAGRVHALDPSAAMLATAQSKVRDQRVSWHQARAESIPLAPASVDRVLCLSVWPHIDRPKDALLEFHRVSRPGAWLHIWHLLPRQRLNHLHAHASEAVANDILAPAEELAMLLEGCAWRVTRSEDAEQYLVCAQRMG